MYPLLSATAQNLEVSDMTPKSNFWSIKTLHLFALMTLVFAMSGCSEIGSSISDSVSSPFKWSSNSSKSSSGASKEAYQGDVKYYTEVYTRSSYDVAGFARGLASIGEKHGISNWEADGATYVGIGEGLAKAKAPQQLVDLFMAHLAQGNPQKIAAIQKGYELGR
jgi:hypothetical protein